MFVGSFIVRIPWLRVYLPVTIHKTHGLRLGRLFDLLSSFLFYLVLKPFRLTAIINVHIVATHSSVCVSRCVCVCVSFMPLKLTTGEVNDKERRKRHQIMIRINGISSTVFLSLSPLPRYFQLRVVLFSALCPFLLSLRLASCFYSK